HPVSIQVLWWAFVCITVCSLATHARGSGYETATDLAYYEEAPDEYAEERCRLDLYHPTETRGFPTVVWLHAGGLVQGQRYIPGELKELGIAVAAVDYRLSPKAQAPAYIQDAAAATAWVIENIERYGGDPERVIIAGASAGGYLALMVGLDASWLEAHEIEANDLAAIVSMGGQAITHVAVRAERGIGRTTTVIDDLAPLHHVRGDAPPILLTTGDRELELLGRHEENAYLVRMLNEVGHAAVALHEIEGADHGAVEERSYPAFLAFLEARLEFE
ncbi:MAG: alpha/beta hydrolase, partial [Planctomycetota bacterium]